MILFDYIVLSLLLISAIAGFKAGFLQTVFKAIGFIAGGVIGVAVAVNAKTGIPGFNSLSFVMLR